jgi:hypothetical protein
MSTPYTKSGKCGGIVWQRNRYGQISYPAFIPINPRTPAQLAVRESFGSVSKRWRTLTQPQRNVWNAVGSTKMSRPRLGCGPLTGFNYFVKVNVALANRGQPQLDLPPEFIRSLQYAGSGRFDPAVLDQLPIGPTLFLHANPLNDDRHNASRPFPALGPPTA